MRWYRLSGIPQRYSKKQLIFECLVLLSPLSLARRSHRISHHFHVQVSYADLLKLFWTSHDPTQGMRQGNDAGTQVAKPSGSAS